MWKVEKIVARESSALGGNSPSCADVSQYDLTAKSRATCNFVGRLCKRNISWHLGTRANARLRSSIKFIGMLGIALFGSVEAARSEDSQAWLRCRRSLDEAVVAINACTEIIDKSNLTGERLASAYSHRSVAYDLQNDFENAIKDISQAINIDPNNDKHYIMRGFYYFGNRSYSLSAIDFDHVAKINPENIYGLRFPCIVRSYSDELQRALSECSILLKKEPKSDVLFHRGIVFLKLGRFQNAIADFDADLKRKSEPFERSLSLYGRGISRIRSGDNRRGRVDIASAKLLNVASEKYFIDHGIKK